MGISNFPRHIDIMRRSFIADICDSRYRMCALMKYLLPCMIILFTLCGCSDSNSCIEEGLKLRTQLQQSTCSFDAKITADYGNIVHTFVLSCISQSDGSVAFTLQEPQSIQGITGIIHSQHGELTFADTAVAFPTLADGELSPVSAPWILLNTLRSGYIRCGCLEEGNIRLTIDDSYQQDALQLDIWLNDQEYPKFVQISWQGRSVLSIEVSNFTFV